MSDPLRLKAKDAEDLQIVSAMLQDALVPTGDMSFDRTALRFMFAASRFRWEDAEAASRCTPPVYEWVNCVVHVEGVRDVQYTGLDLTATGKIHELLAVFLEDGRLKLVFAGGAALRLQLDSWTVRLEDFGAPWPTMLPPQHAASQGTS